MVFGSNCRSNCTLLCVGGSTYYWRTYGGLICGGWEGVVAIDEPSIYFIIFYSAISLPVNCFFWWSILIRWHSGGPWGGTVDRSPYRNPGPPTSRRTPRRFNFRHVFSQALLAKQIRMWIARIMCVWFASVSSGCTCPQSFGVHEIKTSKSVVCG